MTTLADRLRAWCATRDGYSRGASPTTISLRALIEESHQDPDAEVLRGVIDSAYGTDAVHGLIAQALVEAGWFGPLTVQTLAEHAPYVNPGTGHISACMSRGCDGLRFGTDEDGNRLKDDEPARRWATHVIEVLRG